MNPNMTIAINSNLGAKQSIIDRFKTKLKGFENFHLYTSMEATHKQGRIHQRRIRLRRMVLKLLTHDGG